MTILLWLIKLIGIKEVTKWAVRLVVLGLLLFILLFIFAGLFFPFTRAIELKIAIVIALIVLLRAVWIRRADTVASQTDAGSGPRTIDGKIVPKELAESALRIPTQAPDGDYVLRGLPDYGKALLKLDSAEFEYVPEAEIYEEVPELPELRKPTPGATNNRFQRWGIAAGVAIILVIAGLGTYYARKAVSDRQAAELRQQQELERQKQEHDRQVAELHQHEHDLQVALDAARQKQNHTGQEKPPQDRIDPEELARKQAEEAERERQERIASAALQAKLMQVNNQISEIEGGDSRVTPIIEDNKQTLLQAGAGPLRGDVTSHQSDLVYNLRQAKQAVNAGDPEGAAPWVNKAQSDLDFLKHWAGLR